MRVSARKMLKYSTEKINATFTGEFDLQFDDGTVIRTTAERTILSRFAWNYHIAYPNVPILPTHHIDSVIGPDGIYYFNAHLQLFNSIYWEAFNRNRDLDPAIIPNLNKLFYAAGADLFAVLSMETLRYSMSVTISDYVALIAHPSVQPLIEAIKDNDTIAVATAAMKKLLMSFEMRNNPLALLSRMKVINEAQLMQCLVSRGPATDINSAMFAIPVLESYVYGIRNAVSAQIESRGANKAQFFTGPNLERAEYFSRRTEILAMSVWRLHAGDCGSQRYLNMMVMPPKIENGRMTYRGDLAQMVGCFYMDAESNTLKTISARDKHLEGKYIRLRSPVAGCNHPDPGGVCMTCFGMLGESIYPLSNIGTVCSKYTCNPISQGMMKVKHIDSGNVAIQIALSLQNQGYFTLNDDRNGYVLKPPKHGKLSLIIPAIYMYGFSDLRLIDDITTVSTTTISEVPVVGLKETIQDAPPMIVSVPTAYAGLSPNLTHTFLQYMMVHGYSTDAKGNYVIDLSNWNFDDCFLIMPFKHFSMADHADEFARILESSQKEFKKRSQDGSAEVVLQELARHVNSAHSIHISNLGILLYATMGVDPENGDYALPKADKPGKLGVADSAIFHRSLAAVFAYEKQAAAIMDSKRIGNLNLPDHPMDVMFKPQEVLDALK